MINLKKCLTLFFVIVFILMLVAGCGADEVVEEQTDEVADDIDVEDFPHKMINFILGANPGSTPDFLSRGLAIRLQDINDVPVIVTNLVGANHMIACEEIRKADPDGHSLWITIAQTFAQHVFVGNIEEEELFDIEIFGILIYDPSAIIVANDSPIKDFGDLVEKDLVRFGDGGNQSGGVPPTVMLLNALGIDFKFTPGYTSAEMFTAVLAGEQELLNRSPGFLYRQGMENDFRVIAVYSKERHPLYPDVPTLFELAEEYGFEWEDNSMYHNAYFIAAPPGTPEAIVEKLQKDIKYIMTEDEEFINWATENYVIGDMYPEMIDKEVAISMVKQFINDYAKIADTVAGQLE
ncbi:MAG: tripartite tricarboxylate transporter substrate-binding protein [Bacillota bacterium]|nr:tripartite tricarboxylate transporter substrate-binding protein [Bacillota bacterium]